MAALNVKVKCRRCGGSGIADYGDRSGLPDGPCPVCKQTGQVSVAPDIVEAVCVALADHFMERDGIGHVTEDLLKLGGR